MGVSALAFAASEPQRLPDLSGNWESPGFDLAPGDDGAPGPVLNMSKDIQRPIGNHKNPVLQPWAAAQVKKWADETMAGRAPAHVHALCLPTGVPGVMTLHGSYQFLQAKDKVTVVIANQTQVRHIYLDVPHSKNVKPSWYGESVGHYEGEVLVVDTVGIRADAVAPIDRFGTPHTENMHVVERIHRTGPKSLRIDYRIEDPGAFTKPWSASLDFHPFGDWDEQTCAENNVDETGKIVDGLPTDSKPAF